MKRSFAVLTVPCSLTLVLACGQAETTDSAAAVAGPPTELADKVAYAMGANLGRGLKQQNADLDIAYILRGLEDGMGDGELAMTQEEMQGAVQEFQQQMARETGDKNRAAGEEFLASNAEREEVTTLPSCSIRSKRSCGRWPTESPSCSATARCSP